jgi:hypothetical protein
MQAAFRGDVGRLRAHVLKIKGRDVSTCTSRFSEQELKPSQTDLEEKAEQVRDCFHARPYCSCTSRTRHLRRKEDWSRSRTLCWGLDPPQGREGADAEREESGV